MKRVKNQRTHLCVLWYLKKLIVVSKLIRSSYLRFLASNSTPPVCTTPNVNLGMVLYLIDRYQIFLGTNLTDTFLNVIDGSGQGENLCELVGGHQEYASPWNYGVNAPNLTGILIKCPSKDGIKRNSM